MNTEQPHNIDVHIQNTEKLALINPEKIEISDPLISAVETGNIESFNKSLQNSLLFLQTQEGEEYDVFRNMQNHTHFLHYLGFEEEYSILLGNSKIKNQLIPSIINAVKTNDTENLWKSFLEIREYGKIQLLEAALNEAMDTLKASGDIGGHVRLASFISSRYLNLSSTYEKTSKNKYKQIQYWQQREESLNIKMNSKEFTQDLNSSEKVLVENTIEKIKTKNNALIFKDFKKYITLGDRVSFEKVLSSVLNILIYEASINPDDKNLSIYKDQNPQLFLSTFITSSEHCDMGNTYKKITKQMKEVFFIKQVSEHKSYFIGDMIQIILSDLARTQNIQNNLFQALPPEYKEIFTIPNFSDKNIQRIATDLGWDIPENMKEIQLMDIIKGDIIKYVLLHKKTKNLQTKDFIRICTIQFENRLNELQSIQETKPPSLKKLPDLMPEQGAMKKGDIIKISSGNESDLFQSYTVSIKNPNYNKDIKNSFPEYRIHFNTVSRSEKSRTNGIPYETFPEFAIGPSLWGEKTHQFKIHISNELKNTGMVNAWSTKTQEKLNFTGLSPHYGSPFESEGCMTAFSLEGINEEGKSQYIFGQPDSNGDYKIQQFKKNKRIFENILGSILQGKRMLIKNYG